MATAIEISNELKRLLGAYPAVRPANPETTAQEFITQLQEFSPEVIRMAVNENIRNSKWFPTLAELIGLCRKYELDAVTDKSDWMAARLVGLEDAWYQDGEFEEGEWMQLIEYFEKSERTCGAEQARRKFGHIKQQAVELVQVGRITS